MKTTQLIAGLITLMGLDLKEKGICSQIAAVVYFSVSDWHHVSHSVYFNVGEYQWIK